MRNSRLAGPGLCHLNDNRVIPEYFDCRLAQYVALNLIVGQQRVSARVIRATDRFEDIEAVV